MFEFFPVSKAVDRKSNTGGLFACTFLKISPSEHMRGTANIYTTRVCQKAALSGKSTSSQNRAQEPKLLVVYILGEIGPNPLFIGKVRFSFCS